MPEYSQTDRTAGELDWPAWAERTPPGERRSTHKYSVTLAQAIDDVETELVDRLGVDGWRLSTAAPHRKRDGRPYADADPDDPGVAVRWSMAGEQYCVACDEYTRIRDNVRTIGLYIAEKRKMSDRPVRTGQDEFATARLPSSGDEDGEAMPPDGVRQPPHEVLGVAADAPEAVVRGAARSLKADAHPDNGGDRETFQRIAKAEEAMLDGE
jgi:hypothetical protein